MSPMKTTTHSLYFNYVHLNDIAGDISVYNIAPQFDWLMS